VPSVRHLHLLGRDRDLPLLRMNSKIYAVGDPVDDFWADVSY
jgi:hypothetical protein